MTCKLCSSNLITGEIYRIDIIKKKITCFSCGHDNLVNVCNVRYDGINKNNHSFILLDSFHCAGCGENINYLDVPCGEHGHYYFQLKDLKINVEVE